MWPILLFCFNILVASKTAGQVSDPVNINAGLSTGLRNILTMVTTNTTKLQDQELIDQDIAFLRVFINEITKPDSSVKATISDLMGDVAATKIALVNIGITNALVDTLMQSQVTLHQVKTLHDNNDKRSVVCNATSLVEVISIPTTALLNAQNASNELCSLTNTQQDALWNVLRTGVYLPLFTYVEGTVLLLQAVGDIGLNPADLLVFFTFRMPALDFNLHNIFEAAVMISFSPGDEDLFNSIVVT